jgi:TRAP transporter TAXI family solute receptor
MKPWKFSASNLILIALGLLTLCVVGTIAVVAWQNTRVHHVTLAAGSSTGESYIIGTALRTVVERHYPRVKMTIVETGGTVDSLRAMEEGRAQMAAAQADIAPGPSARIVAVLYDDTFQLLVHKGSNIRSFSDLKSKTIALPQSGGQFQSFLRVAAHFGISQNEFHFVGSNDSTADKTFLDGKADALFRVRALGNPSIQRMVQTGLVEFIRIDHAAAMKIGQPAFEPAVIPEGAYLGEPPVPSADLPTVSIHRTLLADSSADFDAVRAVTDVLMDHRQEIMAEIPPQMPEVRLLLASVRRPQLQMGIGPALHPAALSFYDKDKPSFLLAHADYVGLMLTVFIMIGSWIWELKRWMQRQQKNRADEYSRRVLQLLADANQAKSLAVVEEIKSELLDMLTKAVQGLDNDELSEDSFHSFRAVLQIALDVAKERYAQLVSSGTFDAAGAVAK